MAQATHQNHQRPENEGEPFEPFESYAWRVHQALHDWTVKVDAKASVVMTLETAILGMIVVFVGHGKRLEQLHGWEVWSFRTGVGLLVCAIALAGTAVFPQLNRRDARRNWSSNHVYFGHLRRWEPENLLRDVENGSRHGNQLVLSTQVIVLSKIVWRKHAFLQYSMTMVLFGNATIWAPLLLA